MYVSARRRVHANVATAQIFLAVTCRHWVYNGSLQQQKYILGFFFFPFPLLCTQTPLSTLQVKVSWQVGCQSSVEETVAVAEGHAPVGAPRPMVYSGSVFLFFFLAVPSPRLPIGPAGLAHVWHIIDSLIMWTDVSGPAWHSASSPAYYFTATDWLTASH